MNSHDRHKPKPSDTNNTDNDSESKTSIEFSVPAKLRALRNDTAFSRQERTEKILALITNNKHKRLKEQIAQFTGHHSVSSLEVYIDAAIRDEK